MMLPKIKNRKIKVLVIRFSSIGDIVLTTPVLRALKQNSGLKVETHFATKKDFAELLEYNPYVDQLHLHDGKLSELIQNLKNEHYDLIIDLHNSTRSRILTFRLGKPATTFNKLNIRKWILTNFKINLMPNIHVVDRYLKTLQSLDAIADDMGLDYFFPDRMPAIEDLLPELFHKGYIAFAIGGRHLTKRLPNEKIVAIIQKLPHPVVLLGDHGDAGNAEFIAAACGSKIYNACGRLSLHESAWLVKNATAVITHDTGLMHIAAAFNKPLVSVWGNTVPDFGMAPYMPRFPERSKIMGVDGLACRPCSKLGYSKCPKNHFDCMMQMDKEWIARKVCKLADEQISKLAD